MLEGENWIAGPIEVLYSRCVKLHLFQQRPADGLNNISFNLIPQPVRINNQPAVMRYAHALHRNLTGRTVNLDLRDSRNNRAAAVGEGDSPPDSFRCGRTLHG